MIRHLAGIAEIVDDVNTAAKFYEEVLGLTVKRDPDQGYATIDLPGILHFGIWSRAAAAESVFGDAKATERIPLGFTIGLEVDDVNAASDQMKSKGWKLAQLPKKEPWDQVTARFFLVSGALAEVSETPWARTIKQNVEAEKPT